MEATQLTQNSSPAAGPLVAKTSDGLNLSVQTYGAKALLNLQALSRSPSPAQTLPSEAVLDALKMMLIGASLNEVVTSVTV